VILEDLLTGLGEILFQAFLFAFGAVALFGAVMATRVLLRLTQRALATPPESAPVLFAITVIGWLVFTMVAAAILFYLLAFL
jgi:hypothetical protein